MSSFRFAISDSRLACESPINASGINPSAGPGASFSTEAAVLVIFSTTRLRSPTKRVFAT